MMFHVFRDALIGAAILCGVAFLFVPRPIYAGECRNVLVSWYGEEHDGRKTASGSRFNQWAMTAAMPSRAHLGERWRVSYGRKSVVVKVTDTGGFAKYGRGMDLARGAFNKLANEGAGVIQVRACRVG